ncbi:hypothetical protein, partial [Ralstonia solanacearum]
INQRFPINTNTKKIASFKQHIQKMARYRHSEKFKILCQRIKTPALFRARFSARLSEYAVPQLTQLYALDINPMLSLHVGQP